jgi:hypothetical protein
MDWGLIHRRDDEIFHSWVKTHSRLTVRDHLCDSNRNSARSTTVAGEAGRSAEPANQDFHSQPRHRHRQTDPPRRIARTRRRHLTRARPDRRVPARRLLDSARHRQEPVRRRVSALHARAGRVPCSRLGSSDQHLPAVHLAPTCRRTQGARADGPDIVDDLDGGARSATARRRRIGDALMHYRQLGNTGISVSQLRVSLPGVDASPPAKSRLTLAGSSA